MSRQKAALLFVFLLPGILTIRAQIKRNTELPSTESRLASTDPGMVKYSLVISPDANHLAYVAHRGNQKCVVLDGVEGKLYPDIPEGHLNESGRRSEIRFSKTGGHIAYVAGREGQNFVVLDGVEGKPYKGIAVGAPVFSPDGKHLAYIASQHRANVAGQADRAPGPGRQDEEVVVVDGVPGKPFDYITAVPLRFSPDSKHIGYPGRRGNVDVLVMDGVETAQGEYVGFVDYSSDGKRTACKIVQGEKSRMIVDGVAGAAYEHIGNGEIFTPDGSHVMFKATIDGFDHLIVDGVPSKYNGRISENNYSFGPGGIPFCVFDSQDRRCVAVGSDVKCYDAVQNWPTFSPDGKRVAVSVIRNRKAFVVIDGMEGPAYDEAQSVGFNKTGKRTLYAAKRGDRQFAVVDGVEHPYDEITSVFFSPDGNHFGVAGKRNGMWCFDIDGKPGKSLSDTPIFAVEFSPDGNRVGAVVQRKGQMFLVADGAESGPFDSVQGVEFTGDSKHLVFTIIESGKTYLIIDGKRSKPYDGFETPLTTDSDKIKFVARRGNEYLRVEARFNP